jgi:hypothetical protein
MTYFRLPSALRHMRETKGGKGAIYECRLKSSWTHLITPSRNFVKVRWRSLLRSTSLGKRWTFYNVPPTSRKRAADRLQQTSGASDSLFTDLLFPSRTQKSIAQSWRSTKEISTSCSAILKRVLFKTTLTQTLKTVRGMQITPLLRQPHHYNLA